MTKYRITFSSNMKHGLFTAIFEANDEDEALTKANEFTKTIYADDIFEVKQK